MAKKIKDKYYSIKHYIEIRGELICSGRVSSSCYTSGTRRVTVNKGNNKITKLRTILQRESQNS